MGARPVGRSAVLLEVEDAQAARGWAEWARTGGLECVDAVPAARTVLFDGVADVAGAVRLVEERLASEAELPPVAGERRSVVLPVRYDGADLERIATAWGITEDEVVRRHTSIEFTSAFCGFAPGFAYLEGLPREWALPRLDVPRARVGVGSVALADTWCGVYPTPSPGGWLILGTTDVAVWDLAAAEPALLAPGVRVRFEAL